MTEDRQRYCGGRRGARQRGIRHECLGVCSANSDGPDSVAGARQGINPEPNSRLDSQRYEPVRCGIHRHGHGSLPGGEGGGTRPARRTGVVGSITESDELFVFTTYAVFVSSLNAAAAAPGSGALLLFASVTVETDWSIRLKKEMTPPDDGSLNIAVCVSVLMPTP